MTMTTTIPIPLTEAGVTVALKVSAASGAVAWLAFALLALPLLSAPRVRSAAPSA